MPISLNSLTFVFVETRPGIARGTNGHSLNEATIDSRVECVPSIS